VATATAEGLLKVAAAVIDQGGAEASQLRVAEQYIQEFGRLAKAGNTFVVPANLADLTSIMALATNIAKQKTVGGAP
jgi:phospholipase/lecithinase/hemolysin